MKVIYVPMKIESAEQAEALPEDTVAIRPQYFACEKHCGVWRNTDAALLGNHDLVGFTALVPIEAEEETERRIPFDGRSGEDLPPPMGGRYRRTVYATPWEGA